MARSGGPGGPSQVPGWVLSANEVIERLFLMVRIHLLWCVLTLLGLVVLGLAPATAAAADALIASREGGRLRVLPVMWDSYRRQFVRVNARMLPLMAVRRRSPHHPAWAPGSPRRRGSSDGRCGSDRDAAGPGPRRPG